VERPGWSVTTHRGSAPWVHGGYTGGRRPVRLAGREADDHAVLSPHVDPTHVELGRLDRPRDHTEVTVGSGREVPCLIHVEPDESAANGVGAFHRGPDMTKVCGPTVLCHHEHHRWPAAAGRPAPGRMGRGWPISTASSAWEGLVRVCRDQEVP
jgi:hypothetical protein